MVLGKLDTCRKMKPILYLSPVAKIKRVGTSGRRKRWGKGVRE
jgi:hypothetical protein